MTTADAERMAVKEGLQAMGYVERPTDAADLFRWYLRQMGFILGLGGLISMGYGVFGERLFSIIGFGLLLAGFLFLALELGLEHYDGWADGRLDADTADAKSA